MGRFHALKYNEIKNTELISVCDINKEAAISLAKECNTNFCYDYKSLINKVDAVTIAATTSAHFEIAKDIDTNQIRDGLNQYLRPKT